MADLTHTVTLTVTIEGVVRPYKYTTVISGAETFHYQGSGHPNTEEIDVIRDGTTPLFMLAHVKKTAAPIGVTIINQALTAQTGPLLMYGGYFCCHKAAAGGNFNSSDTATTSTFLVAWRLSADALLGEAHGAVELYAFYA